MGIRDQEFERLLLYAKGLGLKVTVYNRPGLNGIMAAWSIDGTEMIIYADPKLSKTENIMSIIHELGHHKHFLYNNKKTSKSVIKALEAMDIASKTNGQVSKKNRQVIYDDEANGIKWWDEIIHETNIKLPKWRIDAQKELDLWVYEYFLETGKWATLKQKKQKFKEVKVKWRNK